MAPNTNIVDALKAVIATRNWDFAGELADDAGYVDCLRCFAGPRRILFDRETPSVFMCLFCASCWYLHEKHRNTNQRRRRIACADCEICNVVEHHHTMEEILALQALRAAERRFLSAHGWTRNGDSWDPPKNQRFKYLSGYNHNHAVNALKQRLGENRQREQPRNPSWSPTYDD